MFTSTLSAVTYDYVLHTSWSICFIQVEKNQQQCLDVSGGPDKSLVEISWASAFFCVSLEVVSWQAHAEKDE